MAACHRLSSNRFAAFADSLKSKTWTSVYASSILHCTHAAPTEFQNRASPIEEACDNRRQTVHFYEVLDRADLRSRSIAAHTIFQESLTGEFAWETERSSYQIRHCRCKKKREGLRANTTKREREKGKSRRKGNRDLRWMCLEDHRIVPICLDTSLHEETREDSDRVHGNPFYEKRKSYRWQIRNKKEKRILIKEVSRLFCKLFFFYSGYDKFEILVDEIRYVSFEIKKKKRENQRNIEIFSFIQIATNLKFYLFQIVCKFYDILEKLLTVGGQL